MVSVAVRNPVPEVTPVKEKNDSAWFTLRKDVDVPFTKLIVYTLSKLIVVLAPTEYDSGKPVVVGVPEVTVKSMISPGLAAILNIPTNILGAAE